MQHLGLALKARGQEGEPLPPVFARLDGMGAKFRRGQTSLIAAAPGGGKSAFATYYSVRTAYDEFTGVPTLYFSADCDRMTMAKGIAAGVLGRTLDDVESLIANDDPETYLAIEEATEHIWFCFDPSPGMLDVYEEVNAYVHVNGEYPHLIIIDNLMDVTVGGNEYERFNDIIQGLNGMARDTGAHVMILCHVTGFYTDGNQPIPRSAIIQKVDKKARLILTLYKRSEGVMGVRIVKNTTGRASSDGSYGPDYAWSPGMGWFGE